MSRDKAIVKGVIVPGSTLNAEAWKETLRQEYESPDQHGKSKVIEFENVTDDDGSFYINYWVSE
jgi:hypothetical protein